MAFLKTVEESNKKKIERKENLLTNYKTKKNKIHKLIYNTSRWRKLRLAYMSEHPLCEMCLNNNKKVLANHIHHKIEISNGKDDNEMIEIAFDYNNLQSLCEDCHKKVHEDKRTINYFLFDN